MGLTRYCDFGTTGREEADMAAWLSAGTPHGKERCACPADEGSTAAAHPARSGDTQAVLLTDLSGSRGPADPIEGAAGA